MEEERGQKCLLDWPRSAQGDGGETLVEGKEGTETAHQSPGNDGADEGDGVVGTGGESIGGSGSHVAGTMNSENRPEHRPENAHRFHHEKRVHVPDIVREIP